MGLILTSSQDYNAVRGVLGIDKDVEHQLTDDVINELQFLPAAEAEAIQRITSQNYIMVMQLDPQNPSQIMFKAGTVALCASNLTRRLEITVPVAQRINDLGEVERTKIDWKEKWQLFRSDANYFFGYIDPTFLANDFPPALGAARGRVTRNDPQFHRDPYGFSSDFTGYVGPSGVAYNFWQPNYISSVQAPNV